MRKELLIPVVLAATVLVAGTFAFMPMQEASTVHSTLLLNRVVSNYVSLDGIRGTGADFDTGTKIDLLDTSHIQSSTQRGHVVAALPNTDAACTAGDAADTGLEVRVGNVRTPAEGATVLSTNLLVAATNTGITAGPPADWDGDGIVEALCIFHVDVESGVGGLATTVSITDHIVGVFGAGRILPDGAYATVISRL